MAWHMGHPLSTSIFTSYHIDRLLWPEPKKLEDARFDRSGGADPGNGMLHIVLRAYCVGLIKCCNFVHRRIGTEHYYEVGWSRQELVAALKPGDSPLTDCVGTGRRFRIKSIQSNAARPCQDYQYTRSPSRGNTFYSTILDGSEH